MFQRGRDADPVDPSPAPTGSAGPDAAALEAAQAALAAEHAAVWAYGVIGARVAKERRDEARQAHEAHVTRRDSLARTVRRLGAAPVAAEAAYALPFRPDTAADAVRLAAGIEDGVAGACADLVRAARGSLRREAADALGAAAVRAARWRGVGVAFPGLAERKNRATES
ncbi:DUF4439 domain-containing protein [Streptomyces sp. BI20]|uniref:DUF4439 domain-containing protein n=1 Tax=Streptomyces sp. BI20 TaxID=3403460 RepID=UPI003C757BAB